MASPSLAVAQPLTIGRVTIPNRLVMAPMTRCFADKETSVHGDAAVSYYSARAAGGIGLIVTEGVHVNGTTAVDAPGVPRCRTPEQIAAWKKIADAVHAAGGKIAMQLWHTGVMALRPVGPSAVDPAEFAKSGAEGMPMKAAPSEITVEQMQEIAQDFATTAANAVHGAGFDAVEIHGAHGYLLDSFLSKKLNLRTDDFGGSIANRSRFPVSVIKAVKNAVGDKAPVIYRFSQWTGLDFSETKFDTSAELAEFLSLVTEAGVDALHVSTRNALKPGFPEEHKTRTLAGWTKVLTGLPTIAVGGIGLNRVFAVADFMPGTSGFEVVDPTPATDLVDKGEVDAIAIGRMLLSDKDFGAKILDGSWKSAVAYSPEVLASFN